MSTSMVRSEDETRMANRIVLPSRHEAGRGTVA